jgi:hypothetical protein
MSRFWDYVAESQAYRDPHKKAWAAVERDLMAAHGLRRYRTYESFRTGKWKRPMRVRLTVVVVLVTQ